MRCLGELCNSKAWLLTYIAGSRKRAVIFIISPRGLESGDGSHVGYSASQITLSFMLYTWLPAGKYPVGLD